MGVFDRIFSKDGTKQVGLLASGAALAQLIAAGSLPILTRLYSPADFSLLSIYVASLGIIVPIACGRYEIAIPVAKSEGQAVSLLQISIILSVIAGVLVFCIGQSVIFFANTSDVVDEWFFASLSSSVVFLGVMSSILFLFTRQKKFSYLTKSRLLQSILIIVLQIFFWFLWPLGASLLAGQTLGIFSSLIFVLIFFVLKDGFCFKMIGLKNKAKLIAVARRFSGYPKYSVPEALLNAIGYQGPIIMIGFLAMKADAGFLMLAMKALQVPMSLLGTAIAQVFLSLSNEYQKKNEISALTLKTIHGLLRSGVGPIIAIGLLSPLLIPLILGKEWSRSSEIILWMIPWFVFQFLTSPISMVMHVKKLQLQMLYVSMFGAVFRLLPVLLGFLFFPNKMPEIYAVSSALFYFGCFLFFSHCADLKLRNILSATFDNFFVILLWIAVSLFLLFALR